MKELVVSMGMVKTQITVAAGLKAVSSKPKEKLSYLVVLVSILLVISLFMIQIRRNFM